MAREFGFERPEVGLQNRTQAQTIWNNRVLFSGSPEVGLDATARKIIEVGTKIGPRICKLPGNEGTEGFMIGISENKPGYPTLTVQIGTINKEDSEYGPDGKKGKYDEFARLKTSVIRQNKGFISSGQNAGLPESEKVRSSKQVEIPSGAIAVGENNRLIIAISAFKNAKMDTAISLAIAVGAGIVTMSQAVHLSQDPRVDCKREFLDSGIQDIIIEEVLPHSSQQYIERPIDLKFLQKNDRT